MMSGTVVSSRSQGFFGAVGGVHDVSATAEEGGLRSQEVPVVVDEEDWSTAGTHLGLLSPLGGSMGISTWKVVPTPGSDSNQMLPLCILTMP